MEYATNPLGGGGWGWGWGGWLEVHEYCDPAVYSILFLMITLHLDLQ